MKSYIFPNRELRILKAFIEKEEKLEGWRDLKYRITKHHKRLQEHYSLMEQALQKMKKRS